MSKLIVVADSTQVDSFLQCERYWSFRDRERLSPADVEESKALLMGQLGHKYLERLYKTTAVSREYAVERILEFNPDIEACGCGHSIVKHANNTIGENICTECLDETPCYNFIPIPYPLDKPNREVVKQRIREYCYTYLNNDIIPDSPESVEVGFSELLYEDDEVMFVLEGRIDFIGSLQGVPLIVDHKFQLREKNLYKKSIQFRNYAMVSHKNTLMLNMVRLAKSTTNKTFERPLVTFTEYEHSWWRCELIKIFHRMAYCLSNREYTPNWSACAGRYGYECDYTRLCEPTEQDPALIQAKKDTLYQVKPVWRPW